jgi:hypothetical protein
MGDACLRGWAGLSGRPEDRLHADERHGEVRAGRYRGETVSIPVNGDTLVEPDECILLSLTNPTNAKIRGYYGLRVGTVTNDD